VLEILPRCLLGAAVALCACNAPTPERQAVPATPPGDAAGAAVVRQPLPETPPPAPAVAAPPVSPAQTTADAITVPPGAVYACVVDAAGERQVTAIELAPRVAALCAQNPEMGPCQYEREICRRGGGRVFAADGKEITKATEAEYDRRVLRARIRAD